MSVLDVAKSLNKAVIDLSHTCGLVPEELPPGTKFAEVIRYGKLIETLALLNKRLNEEKLRVDPNYDPNDPDNFALHGGNNDMPLSDLEQVAMDSAIQEVGLLEKAILEVRILLARTIPKIPEQVKDKIMDHVSYTLF